MNIKYIGLALIDFTFNSEKVKICVHKSALRQNFSYLKL